MYLYILFSIKEPDVIVSLFGKKHVHLQQSCNAILSVFKVISSVFIKVKDRYMVNMYGCTVEHIYSGINQLILTRIIHRILYQSICQNILRLNATFTALAENLVKTLKHVPVTHLKVLLNNSTSCQNKRSL